MSKVRVYLLYEDPSGKMVEDKRHPFYALPEWVAEPFPTEPDGISEDHLLKDGRYKIESVIQFSNAGGVYIAKDTHSDKKVLIKEARPLANVQINGIDAVTQVLKEYRILEALKPYGIAPLPVDLFKDWEHLFLVEEFIEGISLRGFNASHSLALRIAPTAEDANSFFQLFRKLYSQIASMIATVHDLGIVLTDLSHNNILVGDEANSVRLIDFDAAFEPGIDIPALVVTTGFASQDRYESHEAKMHDDCFCSRRADDGGDDASHLVGRIKSRCTCAVLGLFLHPFRNAGRIRCSGGVFARPRASKTA